MLKRENLNYIYTFNLINDDIKSRLPKSYVGNKGTSHVFYPMAIFPLN